MTDSSDDSDDRRNASRRRTLLGGILIHGPAQLTLDCTIRDLSDTGARVRMRALEVLIKPLALLAYSLDQAFEAEVSWQRDGETGLIFSRALNLEAPASDLEKTVRRLWLERRRR